jgi:beta-lactamase regulating signal transducer with metallopeptidase domain
MMMSLILVSAVRSLVVGGVTWLGLTLLRVRNPHVQSLAWTVALLASLAMPLLVFVAQSAAPSWAAVPLPYAFPAAEPAQAVASAAPMAQSAAAPAVPAIDWRAVLTAGYALVAAVLFLRLLVGMALTRRLIGAAQRFEAERASGADIRISPAVSVPVTFGGTILLPAEATLWSDVKLRAVLAHEQAHVGRGDFYIHMLAQLNRTVFWFNPFAWWLENRLADLAETVSDEMAATVLDGRASYAEILLEVAGGAGRVPVGVAMARSAAVGPRIERILAGVTSRPLSRRTGGLVVLGLAPFVVAAAIAVAAPAQTPDPTQVKVDPGIFDRYVGAYEFDPAVAPNQVVNITRDGDHLFADSAGGPKLELFPQSERVYFEKGIDFRITFGGNGAGPAPSLFLHTPGGKMPGSEAKRIDQAEALRVKAVIEQRLAQAAKPHTAIAVDPKIFDNYAGVYRVADVVFTVTHEADYLFVQAGGQPKLRVFPETDHDFFYKEINAQLSFVTGADGKATELIFHQDGRDSPAKRIDAAETREAEAALAKRIADNARPRTAVAIDPKLLDAYIGRYEASPSNIFTVTRQGDGLFVQFAKQASLPVYPENDHEFFYTIVPAQITFITDTNGRATELVLHQNGQNVAAPRVD